MRIMHSQVRRLRGPRLDCRSHEVPRAEAEVQTCGRTIRWGPCDRQVDTRRRGKGVNTPLTSHVSGIHEIRARELDAEIKKRRVARGAST
jgi:hypothetical protein